MPVTLSITGNTGPEAVGELFAFLGNLQVNLSNGAKIAAQGNSTVEAANVNAPAAEEEKPKKEKKPKEEKPSVKSKYTLQEAIDKAKAIAGDGKDEKVMRKLEDVNNALGIKRVRELPPEKIDGYVEELEKAFPPKAEGSMFD